MEPAWLAWARRLNALAQTGLTSTADPYDIERYTEIRTIAAEMIARVADADAGQVLGLLAGDAGYATPKVDVRSVVFRDGKMLMVQGRSDGWCSHFPDGPSSGWMSRPLRVGLLTESSPLGRVRLAPDRRPEEL
jgi:hypothetical protein